MAVKFSKLTPATPETPKLIKCFGHLVPLYPSEAKILNDDIGTLAKARKREKKVLKALKKKAHDPAAFKKLSHLYFSSNRCLQAKMIECNARLPYQRRLSLHQIIEISHEYDIRQKLDEPVNVCLKPKSSGNGFRLICDFGLVARAAQRMFATLLRLTYEPAPFQFTRLGVHDAIKEALRLIEKEGYTHVQELDIKDHYPSFEEKRLIATVPFQKSAIREIGLAASAKWKNQVPSPYTLFQPMYYIPHGIPQGSASSSAIAEWSVSYLKMFPNVSGIALINFADNFFVLGKNEKSVAFALKVLRLAVAKLPGGVFKLHPSSDDQTPVVSVQDGFRMLGCWIKKSGNAVTVDPTEASLRELRGRFGLEAHRIESLLVSAENEGSQTLRRDGVQAFLRLESYVSGWMAAHAVCTDIQTIKEDREHLLCEIVQAYGITHAERKSAKDDSIYVKYHPESTWKHT